MPKIYKNKKKHINPRYFLNESVEREDLIDDIREFSKDVAGSRDTYGDIDKLAEMDLQELEEYFRGLTSSGEERVEELTPVIPHLQPPKERVPTRPMAPIPPEEV